MEYQLQYRQVGCCGAKTWSLVIGWFQTAASAIFLVLTIVLFLGAGVVYEHYKDVNAKELENWSTEDKMTGFDNFNLQLGNWSTEDTKAGLDIFKKELENLSTEDKEAGLDLLQIVGLVVFIFALIKFSINLVSGIILIVGVEKYDYVGSFTNDVKKNPGNLRIWHNIQIFIIVTSVLGSIFGMITGLPSELLINIVSILFTSFCIWVVNIHRDELLNAEPKVGVFCKI